MVTPEYLQYLYKTSGYVPVADGRNKLGVVGFLNQFASEADLATFMALFRIDWVRRATFAVEQLNGGWFDMDLPSGQVNIGIQYAGGMAYPIPVAFYSTGHWPGEALLVLLNFLVSEPNIYIPSTISISYDRGNELELPLGYAIHVCSLFAQLTVRGIAVLAESGIHGVGAGSSQDASGNVRFIAEFPSTCMCSIFINPPKR